MSLTIWKTELAPTHEQLVELPANADILCAREQGIETICIWYRCDPSQPKAQRRIVISGTGHPNVPPPETSRYLGTAALNQGALIFHVFEVTE